MTREEAYTQTQELFAQLHALAHRIAHHVPSGPGCAPVVFAAGFALGKAHMTMETMVEKMEESDGITRA